MIKYSDQQIVEWYNIYYCKGLSLKKIYNKIGVKARTLSNRFNKLGLTLRSSGFLHGNSKGTVNLNPSRQVYLWLYKHAYKRRAYRKGLEFTLSEDQFISIVTTNCHYCGVSPESETRRVHTNRIHMLTVDRVDSNKGYTLDNCVSACKVCNMMKLNLPVDKWLAHMQKILERLS